MLAPWIERGGRTVAESTWESRELPVLEALRALEVEREARRHPKIDLGEVADRVELPRHAVDAAAQALYEADPPYISGTPAWGTGPWQVINLRLTERGRRAVRQWPSDEVYEAFVGALQRRIDAEPDEVKRGKLEALLTHALDVGKGMVGSALVEALKYGLA
jgi:hypothetical protein